MPSLRGLQHEPALQARGGKVSGLNFWGQGAAAHLGRWPAFQPSPVAACTGRARVRAAGSGPGSGPPSAVPDENGTDGTFIVMAVRFVLEVPFVVKALF